MRTIKYDPSAGTHISTAAREAVSLARATKSKVNFRFNDIHLFATRKKAPVTIEWEFNRGMDAAADRPEARARRKQYEIESKEQIRRDQAATDALFLQLPALDGNLDNVMDWVRGLAEHTDRIGVQFSKRDVIERLRALGFERNMHCGRAPSDFQNKKLMGEYIAGQVIDCLENGMPPHPVTVTFVERYHAIR